VDVSGTVGFVWFVYMAAAVVGETVLAVNVVCLRATQLE